MAGATQKEGRRARRKPVLFSAVVAADKGAVTVPCTIRDLSDTGCRITLARKAALPKIVHLVDFPNRVAYEASVMWQQHPQFGLAFLATFPLSSPSTPLFLRKLWFINAR